MKMLCVEENWVPPGEVDSGASAGEMGFAHASLLPVQRGPRLWTHQGTAWWHGSSEA